MDKNDDIFGATVKIKKEVGDEDINEFAETAMNELLGWYGYGASGASREDTKIRLSCISQPGSNSSDADSSKYAEGCEWCGKPVDENKGLTSSGATFCSELCFSQSRRANFKKNKTCDWCRHVRHTVSYVDFQDGASQLQFCSDKCLNQYKMHIFCREARAHLDMHPHIPDDSATGGALITPELWLKNCKSPEPNILSSSNSPKLSDSLPQTSPLPLITVAHPSKFMASIPENMESPKRQRIKVQKRNRKRCPATITCSLPAKSPPLSEIPQDLRVRHTPPKRDFGQLPFREEQRTNFYNRDLVDHFREHLFNVPNDFTGGPPRFVPPQIFNPPQVQYPPAPPVSGGSLVPPVTILVPYPIIIPLPLPIPIPIPISNDDIIKLDEITKKDDEKIADITNESNSQTNVNTNLEKFENPETTTENVKKKVETTDDSNKCINIVGSTKERPARKRKRLAEQKNKLALVKNKNSVPA